MIGILLVSSLGWAGGSLVVPVEGDPAPGECAQAVPVRIGDPIPSGVVGADGYATCTGIIVPPAQLAYLLKLDAYVKASEGMHMLDVDLLKQERNYYRDQLTIATRAPIWYERPSVQRWAGRVETLIAVGLAASALRLGYDAGRGD